jgi:hypothetical protein
MTFTWSIRSSLSSGSSKASQAALTSGSARISLVSGSISVGSMTGAVDIEESSFIHIEWQRRKPFKSFFRKGSRKCLLAD